MAYNAADLCKIISGITSSKKKSARKTGNFYMYRIVNGQRGMMRTCKLSNNISLVKKRFYKTTD